MNEAMNDTTVITEEEFNLKDELAHIDRDIKTAEAVVAKADAYGRLLDHPDYQLVIEDGYAEGEMNRVVEMLSMPTYLKKDQEDALVTIMAHVRYFKAWAKYISEDGNLAEENIEKLKDYRKEVTAGAN